MLYLENPTNTFSSWHGEPINNIRHPMNIEQLWTDAQLAGVSLYRAVIPAVANDHEIVSTTIQRVAGVVTEVHVTRAITYSSDNVNAERDRRIFSGFKFNNILFQNAVEDQKRITGAGALALGAMVAGAPAGYLRWHGGAQDFVWIAADNSTVPMDAQTVFNFAKACASWESDHVFAARALKDNVNGVPLDYTSDSYWPVLG